MSERTVLVTHADLTLCPTCGCYVEAHGALDAITCPFCHEGLDAPRAQAPSGWLQTSSTRLMLTALLGAAVFPGCKPDAPPAIQPEVIAPTEVPPAPETLDPGAARRPAPPTENLPAPKPAYGIAPEETPPPEPKPEVKKRKEKKKTVKTRKSKKKPKLRKRKVYKQPMPTPDYGIEPF